MAPRQATADTRRHPTGRRGTVRTGPFSHVGAVHLGARDVVDDRVLPLAALADRYGAVRAA